MLTLNALIGQELVVYDNISNRSTSNHYLCRVKFESEDDTAWCDAFVLNSIRSKLIVAKNLGSVEEKIDVSEFSKGGVCYGSYYCRRKIDIKTNTKLT